MISKSPRSNSPWASPLNKLQQRFIHLVSLLSPNEPTTVPALGASQPIKKMGSSPTSYMDRLTDRAFLVTSSFNSDNTASMRVFHNAD